MRKVTYPTSINLNEIPAEGREFHYDQDGAELTPTLSDLIGKAAYKVDIGLRPLGNVYEITGKIAAGRVLPCSRCGQDVDHPADFHFTELLVVEKSRPRKSRGTHVHHESEGPYTNYLTSEVFNLAEYIHEQLAANEPFQAFCGRPDCKDFVKSHLEPAFDETHNPFAILKQLKPQ